MSVNNDKGPLGKLGFFSHVMLRNVSVVYDECVPSRKKKFKWGVYLATILPSHMKVSYIVCPDFLQLSNLSVSHLSHMNLHCESRCNDNMRRPRQIGRYNNSPLYVSQQSHCPIVLTQGSNSEWSPLKIFQYLTKQGCDQAKKV